METIPREDLQGSGGGRRGGGPGRDGRRAPGVGSRPPDRRRGQSSRSEYAGRPGHDGYDGGG
ncbi:MAG: hypothetical protein FJX75_19515 [Armatimonadetes bacterium]|nr:hypothetical protein [Armatimonadota bacterium]